MIPRGCVQIACTCVHNPESVQKHSIYVCITRVSCLYLFRLPPPELPPFNKIPMLYDDAIGIAVVAFANNFAMAKLFARKQCYDLDSNSVSAHDVICCCCSLMTSRGDVFCRSLSRMAWRTWEARFSVVTLQPRRCHEAWSKKLSEAKHKLDLNIYCFHSCVVRCKT